MAGPSIVDHAPGGQSIGPRNGELIPQGRHLPNGQVIPARAVARPMFAAEPKPNYTFPGLNGFIAEAAKREGFGLNTEEAGLLARLQTDWFVKQAGVSISSASVATNPELVNVNLERARRMQKILLLASMGIDDAIAHRNPKPEPHLVVTPEEVTAQPESIETPGRHEINTDHGTKHLRSGKPGKLGSGVQ